MIETKFSYQFSFAAGPVSITVDIQSFASSVALRAPSGSGKSTFVRVITGLQKTTSGQIAVNPKIGYVPQDSLLIPTMTVRENLLLSPRSVESDLMVISEKLGIHHLLDRRPRTLSGGEKQRVSIGRALLSKPSLLILDEPFAALDFERRDLTANFIKEWVRDHKMDLILVTHDESSSSLLCEEVWTIKNDQLVVMTAGLK